MFFSKEIIKKAIEGINDVHPFFGITYLSAKQHELPVGTASTCSIDTWNKDFMNQYHKICPESTYFFQPFNSNSREKQWVNVRYPSTGLQAVNTQTFKEAFIHERGGRTWGWADGYVDFLRNYMESFSHPIPAYYIAVWFFKDEDFDTELSQSEIKDRFYEAFHITDAEKAALFNDANPEISGISVYAESVISWDDYQLFISLPPDIAPDPEQENVEGGSVPSPQTLEQHRIEGGTNIILYGVPGSGKSWTIEHEYCPVGSHVERLVFHPDYTNSDFIGQILPVVDKENGNQVTYEFIPGPFTIILRDAYTHPQQNYILVIEELNRGNAPAIFGDIFQLLDRVVIKKTIDGVTYPIGTSEYDITNKNISEIVYQEPTHKIRIPSNLSILATMNTSDQNVFTLDTAFQRRWKMRLIENSFDNVRPSLSDCLILDTGVTWRRFCETINTQIVGNKAKMASSEDKRLGVYFVHENDLWHDNADEPINHDTIRAELHELLKAEMEGSITEDQRTRLQAIRTALKQNRIFPEKVIKYLWDDAFKFNPEAIFDTKDNKELNSLEAVIRMFVYENRGRARFNIFNDTIRALLYEP